MFAKSLTVFSVFTALASAITCPAGTHITGIGANLACTACPIGQYNPSPVTSVFATDCTRCPAGSFVDVTGAKRCCTCCEGFYSSGTGNTACTQCNGAFPNSGAGSTSFIDCSKSGSHTATCSMSGNTCPATSPGGPVGTIVTKKKRDATCYKGYKSCPKIAGAVGSECVDVANDPESCGGCVGPAVNPLDPSTGVDCTSLPNVDVTICLRGTCYIDSCKKGFVLQDQACVVEPLQTQKRSQS